MGNSLSTDASNKRFNDENVFSKTIKDIITDQETVYLGKAIKRHVAKACCIGAVETQDPHKITSIAFPRALDKNNSRCKVNGVCLDVDYVGYQINDKKDKYCKQRGIIGDIELSQNTNPTNENNSSCDNFMQDYCAKTLHEQGCTRMGKNSKGKIVAQFANKESMKMCWNQREKMNYGPPECECLNSIVGPNLNSWPSYKNVPPYGDSNPYGLEGKQLGDTPTKYSLDIFKTDSNKQYPVHLDPRCSTAKGRGDTSIASAYIISKDNQNKTTTICMNQINFIDSDITNLKMDDIKQENNCGPTATIPSDDNTKTDPTKQISLEDAAKADAVVKAKADADKKAKDDADAKNKYDADAKAKVDADAKKQKDEVESLKRLLAESKAKADVDAKNKIETDAKNKADVKAKEESDAKLKADEMAKMKQELEAKAKADLDAKKSVGDVANDALSKTKDVAGAALSKTKDVAGDALSKTKDLAAPVAKDFLKSISNVVGFNVTYIHIGGVILAIILIIVFLNMGKKSKSNKKSKKYDDDED